MIWGQSMIEDVLRIELLDGEYISHAVSLTQLCVIEGSVTPYGRPRLTVFQEALRILELCEEKYSTPHPSGPCFTALISRKTGGASTPVMRLDVFARNGSACAGVESINYPGWDTERVSYAPDDDAIEIVRKILYGPRTA